MACGPWSAVQALTTASASAAASAPQSAPGFISIPGGATGGLISWSSVPGATSYELTLTNGLTQLPDVIDAAQAASGLPPISAVINGQSASDWPIIGTSATLSIPASDGGVWGPIWFMVRARNGNGAGPWSQPVDATGPNNYQGPVFFN